MDSEAARSALALAERIRNQNPDDVPAYVVESAQWALVLAEREHPDAVRLAGYVLGLALLERQHPCARRGVSKGELLRGLAKELRRRPEE